VKAIKNPGKEASKSQHPIDRTDADVTPEVHANVPSSENHTNGSGEFAKHSHAIYFNFLSPGEKRVEKSEKMCEDCGG